YFIYYYDDNLLIFSTQTSAGTANELGGSFSLKDNKWHHLVATYGNGAMKIFADSKLIAQQARTGNLLTGGQLTVGNYFNGSMDELRIYDQALSSAQIEQNFAQGIYKKQLAELTSNSLLK
ncbi:MAG: LamG domain-containing protein, partial [Candidatus Nealsonbacteria bacterium]|nr:LamG domain-containing protein [Candidatus Nealsonbacteria bacterium]